MRRKTLDLLLTSGGLVIAAVLLVAGGLLTWGHNFISSQVRSQLAAQQIFFPKTGTAALDVPQIQPYLQKYAGEQLLTPNQAKAFANHYIAVHLNEIGGGKTYAQLSSEAMADPTNTKLAGTVETVFKGETLRGMLLNAYAFGEMGYIAGIAAIAAFIGAGLMLLLSVLGLWHWRRVAPDATVGVKLGAQTPAPVEP
jgi:hypothetical protein